MNEEIIMIRKHLKKKLLPTRYEHTLSVSFTSMALAMRYQYDVNKAELAGLLHDCAKRFDDTTIIEKCQKKGILLSEEELQTSAVLHAKLGAVLAEEKYGIHDIEILDAIRYHTTGRSNMTLLDKIVYIADYIEPRRNKAPNLDEIRKLAFIDLDEALYQIMKQTLDYLNKKGGSVHSMSREAFLYYDNLRHADKKLKNQ